jgi:hypothetical protein
MLQGKEGVSLRRIRLDSVARTPGDLDNLPALHAKVARDGVVGQNARQLRLLEPTEKECQAEASLRQR